MNKLLPLLLALISMQAWSQCEIAQQQIVLNTDACWTLSPPNNINQSITSISNGQLRMIPRGPGAQLAILPRVYNGAGTMTFDITGLGSWQVGVMSSPSDGGSFIQVASGTVNSSVFSPRTINFAPFQGHQYEYVAIIGTSGPYSNPNITIQNLTYTSGCPATEFPVFNLNTNVSVELDASGNATVSTADFDNGSITTCGNPLDGLSLDVTSFTCADIGTNQLTLSAQYNSSTIGSTPVTLTVLDNLKPTAVGQNLTITVDPITGVGTITTAQVDNGSSDNCNAGLTYSLSKSIFTCEDTGDNIVTLTVEDAAGNSDQVDVTITVQSEASDQVISANNTNICPDGASGTTITTDGSVTGFNYTLRRSSDNSIIDGPVAGTGSGLSFNTGNLNENTTFNILAEKVLSTTQAALDFDGINDYVNATADNRGITTQFTIATWVKTIGTEADIITAKYNGINGFVVVMNVDGKVSIDGRDGVGGYKSSGISSTSINDNEWHYVAGTINLTTGDWKIYVDGVLESSTIQAAGSTLASNANFNIAAQSTLVFPGKFDQLTVWNDELDANEIFTNFTSCLTGSETNIVAHFTFDDGSGSTLSDHSTTNIDGTLINMDAADWIQEVSPSCGDKMCNYQLSAEITIGDVTPPTAVAQNITAPIDLITGVASITAADINNGSSDNCTASLIYSLSKTTFTCDEIGANTVTLTVEDEAGNQATATATVTVELAIQDRVVSASDPVSCADGSSTTIEVSLSETGVDYYLRNSADDNIVSGPVTGTGGTISLNSGSISSAQTFNVFAQSAQTSSSALDFDGSNDLVFASVSPTLNYGNGYTVEAWVFAPTTGASHLPILSIGNTTISDVEIYIQAGTSDLIVSHERGQTNSGGYGFSDPPANQWFHLAVTYDGTNIKTYYDGVEQAVVQSSFAPTGPLVKTNGLLLKVGEVSSTAFGAGGAFFNGQIDEVRFWDHARTSSEITSMLSACLNGTETGLSTYYNFNDGTGTTALDIAGGNNGTLLNMEAGDWVDGAIACLGCGIQMSTEITLGEDNVNPSAQTQNITIQLDVAGDASISLSDINDGSTDDCTVAGSLVMSLDQTSFTCADIGSNTVTLTVEDEAGNLSTATATVTVEDAINPTVITQNFAINLDATGNASISTNDIDNGSSDNCTSAGNLVLSLDKSNFSCSDLGVNTVTLTVEDESGNQATGTAQVTVTDNIAPTVITQNVTLQLDASGNATLNASQVDNGSNDNCTAVGNLTLSSAVSSFDCDDIGSQTVVLTVTDASGNQAFGNSTVTVVDQLAPVVITRDITVNLDNSGNATISTSDIDNGSTDNCTSQLNLIKSIDITSFTQADFGANIVTLTVEDASGNTGTGQATVTVVEKTPQVISFTTISNKVYGDESFALLASSDSGLPVSFNLLSGPGILSGNSVTITGAGTIIVEASQAGNATYGPAAEQQTITVSPAILTVTANNENIAFGDNIPTLSFSYSGFVNGEDEKDLTAEPTASTVATNASDAGTYDIIVSGGVSNNYSFNYQDGTLTISKANQTITVNSISHKLISDPAFDIVATSSSGLALSYAVSGPATSAGSTVTLSGSEGTVEVHVTQAGSINYNSASSTISFEVIDPEQTITFSAIGDKTYGDADVELSASADSGLPVDFALVSGPAILSGTALEITGAGVVIVEASQAGDGIYNSVLAQQTFTVNKADLTVTASDVNIVYGDDIPTLSFDYAGFVNDDDAFDLSAEPTVSTNATSSSNAGTYDVTLSGGSSDDYNLTLINGSLTIAKADQVITVQAIVDKEPSAQPFEVVASVNSDLTLTYNVTGPATISGTTITLSGDEGEVQVTIAQAGDINHNGTTETITFLVAVPLSASISIDEKVTFYPNPVIDVLFVNSENSIDVSIFSMEGRLIKKFSGANGKLDVSSLDAGSYVIRFSEKDATSSQRIIKIN